MNEAAHPEARIFGGRAVIVRAPHDIAIETRQAELGPGQVAVRVRRGGICGSDLHYFHNGGFGAVRLKAPMVLGHEVAGDVVAVAGNVSGLRPGQRVAVNPSLPCGTCAQCQAGRSNHCADMRFFGSAMRWPHVDGGFRDHLVCSAGQAVPLADSVSYAQGALAEPLAVCLHALNRAGDIAGKRVLITGAGPIGSLMVAVCRHAGAQTITVTDILGAPLAVASALGADQVVNTRSHPHALSDAAAEGRSHDIHFEASGNPAALAGGLASLGAGGICVLIGQGAELPLQVSDLIGREIDMRGSFRFAEEFALAVRLLGEGSLKVDAVVTATLTADQAFEAFELASDKHRSCKVQLDFD